MTPFNPESNFTIDDLHSLEDAGIALMTILNNYTQQLQSMLGMYSIDLNTLLNLWVTGKEKISPTWRNLLQIVRQLNLNDLANQVETYLRRTTSEHQPETEQENTITTESG